MRKYEGYIKQKLIEFEHDKGVENENTFQQYLRYKSEWENILEKRQLSSKVK